MTILDTRRTAIVLLLALHLSSCGGSPSPTTPSPSPGPSPVPQPPAVSLVVFRDPASTFTTSDVRDQQDQIVRFNTAEELIWTADATRFSGYRAIGNYLRFDSYFEVVFITKDGDRRAYFTVHGHGPEFPNTVCDIDVVGGQLIIRETNVPLCSPQSSGPC